MSRFVPSASAASELLNRLEREVMRRASEDKVQRMIVEAIRRNSSTTDAAAPTDYTGNQVYYHLYALQFESMPLEFFSRIGKPSFRYLDFGCGNCSATVTLGKLLGLKRHQIFGTDVEQSFEASWGEMRADLSEHLIFAPSEPPTRIIPVAFQKESFDLITANMVLHHIDMPLLRRVLSELVRHLRPGGLIVLKEHDCVFEADFALADLQHFLFALAASPAEAHKFENHLYRSRLEWIELFREFGLQAIYSSYATGPVLRDIHPCRNYFSVFCKV